MEGIVWKVTLLSVVLAATLAFTVPRLVWETDYARFGTANVGIEFLAIPTTALLGFYSTGWQVAFVFFILGRIVWRWTCRRVVDTRFPGLPRAENGEGLPFLRYASLALCALSVTLSEPEYLRVYPVLVFIGALVSAVQGKVPKHFDRTSSGAKKIAFRIGAVLLCVLFIMASELAWRYGTLEVWMWLFCYHLLALSLFSIAIVGPIVLWKDAGEPGLRDP